MKEKRGSITCNGKIWHVILDKNGEVWFYDETKHKTNVGQTSPVSTIEEAKDLALEMLRSLGYCR